MDWNYATADWVGNTSMEIVMPIALSSITASAVTQPKCVSSMYSGGEIEN